MEQNATILTFVGFAPLIQFVGGVYLLLLYDKVLNENPLKSTIAKIKTRHEDFCNNKYQTYLKDTELVDTEAMPNELTSQWDNDIRIRLKRLNIVFLSYCILVLCFIGFEFYDTVKGLSYANKFIACNSILLIYFITTLSGAKWKCLNPFYWIILLLVVFHSANGINNILLCCHLPFSLNISNTVVVWTTIISILLGLLFIFINWGVMALKLFLFNKMSDVLNDEIQIFLLGDEQKMQKLRKKTISLGLMNMCCDNQEEKIIDKTISTLIESEFKQMSIIANFSALKVLKEIRFCILRK